MKEIDINKVEYIESMWRIPKEYAPELLNTIIISFNTTLCTKRGDYDRVMEEFIHSYAELGAIYFGTELDEEEPSSYKKISIISDALYAPLRSKVGYDSIGCLMDIDEFIELCLEIGEADQYIDNDLLKKELELVRETYNRLMKV